jgi:hypothetical protein
VIAGELGELLIMFGWRTCLGSLLLICPWGLGHLNQAFAEQSQGHVASDSAFSPQEKEELYDDRTLLDMFGEAAKEFLTKRVVSIICFFEKSTIRHIIPHFLTSWTKRTQIPDTDEECRWDWRHARCEPYCDCGLELRWGDFHIGRSCRKRVDAVASESCDVTPDTPYTKIFKATAQQGSVVGSKLKLKAAQIGIIAKEKLEDVQTQICMEIPLKCDDQQDEYKRTWRERLFCGHIPECHEMEDLVNEDDDILDEFDHEMEANIDISAYALDGRYSHRLGQNEQDTHHGA